MKDTQKNVSRLLCSSFLKCIVEPSYPLSFLKTLYLLHFLLFSLISSSHWCASGEGTHSFRWLMSSHHCFHFWDRSSKNQAAPFWTVLTNTEYLKLFSNLLFSKIIHSCTTVKKNQGDDESISGNEETKNYMSQQIHLESQACVYPSLCSRKSFLVLKKKVSN